MYKYQCSRPECGSSWALQERNLNGFVLTCPICGKGRGLFISQEKRDSDKPFEIGVEEVVITVQANSAKSIEEMNERIEDFRKRNSLNIVEKDIQSTGKEVICKLVYKIKN